MAKKIELTKEQFEEIRKLYLFEKMTTKQISKRTKISNAVVYKNLKVHGLYVNTNDIDKTGFKKGDLQKEIDRRKELLTKKEFVFNKNLENNDEKTFIAECKITGKKFNDYKNSSGTLTNHLNEIFPGFVHPTNFKKREYKIKNGKYWHEQYFNIVEVENENIEKFKCVYCDWDTNDLKNKSGAYTKHLKDTHKLNVDDYLKENNEHKYLFKTFLDKKEKKDKILQNEDNSVECKICGEKFSTINYHHVFYKHNMTIYEYKTLYNTNETMSLNYKNKLIKNYNENLKNFGHTFTSKSQLEIKDFLSENNIEVELNNRKILNGVEVDILCENKKIGIEYNGNMYHSEVFGKKDYKYHLNKTILMNSNNYFLLQIFEDEWELKKDIVKSKLLQLLGENKLEKIYARKCEIREINKTEKDIFLNKNHIQGVDNSNIYLGAYFNNKLVSVMTFDNKRKMSKHKNEESSYELLRFATDIECRVIGIASKLLSFFIKKYNPKNIISFADRRWTLDKDNNLYTKIGFKLIKTLKPDYSYYNPKLDRYKRYHKFGFGKKSIKKKFPEIFSDEKTEWMMMQEVGYDRIWDCGKFCYELTFN